MRFVDLPDDVRLARAEDYDRIASVVDAWWGRPILESLPRLFLDHFFMTSLVVDGPDGELRAFLVGFASPSRPEEAYIHFVGVTPAERGDGLGERLYRLFFAAAAADGRTTVRCVTSPVNTASIAFHRAMGFTVGDVEAEHNGPGHPLVVFRRPLP
jgi:ribosomal protein S18 acetylase RimI-like enzyme